MQNSSLTKQSLEDTIKMLEESGLVKRTRSFSKLRSLEPDKIHTLIAIAQASRHLAQDILKGQPSPRRLESWAKSVDLLAASVLEQLD